MTQLVLNPLRPVTAESFGLHLVGVTGWDQDGTTPTNTPVHTFGCGSVRVWDTGATWWRVETAKGVFDWSRLDAEMAAWTPAFGDVLYCLGQTPDWASGVVGTGYTRPAPPLDVQDAADYVTALLTRYPQITAIEHWNEPENVNFYSGTVEQLAEISVAQAAAARAVRPNIKIAAACPQSYGDRGEYLREYLRALKAIGGEDAIDAVSVHTYVNPRLPESLGRTVEFLRAIARDEGFGDLEFWSTEFGWGGIPGAPEAGGFYDRLTGEHVTDFGSVMSQEQAVSYIVRSYLISLASGLDRQYFYAVDKEFSAIRLIDFSDKTSVLASGEALAYLTSLLAGGRVGQVRQQGCVRWVGFRSANGRYGQAVWAEDGKTVTYDLSWASEIRDAYGDVISAGDVTDQPVYAFY